MTSANQVSTISLWFVSQSDVDLVTSAYWQPFEGSQDFDLAGSQPGRIQQGVSTIPGHQYEVDFHHSGGPVQKNFKLTFGDTSNQAFSFATAGVTHARMNWQAGALVTTTARGTSQSNLTFTDQHTSRSFGERSSTA